MDFSKECSPAKKESAKSAEELLMEAAVNMLACDPEAQKLLELAQADGVTMQFRKNLKALGAYGFSFAGYPEILVRPQDNAGKFRTALEVAETLVHELRHHWQYKELGITSRNWIYINKDPRRAFFLNRVIEADAMAFQRRFRGMAAGEASAETAENLANWFTEAIENKKMAMDYDLTNAAQIDKIIHQYTYYKTNKTPFDKNKSAPEVTVSVLKGLLRTGVEKDCPAYLEGLTDRQFEKLVLGNAIRSAFHAVRLMQNFRDAVGRKDKKTAERLRPLIREKILSLS